MKRRQATKIIKSIEACQRSADVWGCETLLRVHRKQHGRIKVLRRSHGRWALERVIGMFGLAVTSSDLRPWPGMRDGMFDYA